MAFPGDYGPGVTIREWYAAKAMAGILSTNSCFDRYEECDQESLSKVAFQIADAMIAQSVE